MYLTYKLHVYMHTFVTYTSYSYPYGNSVPRQRCSRFDLLLNTLNHVWKWYLSTVSAYKFGNITMNVHETSSRMPFILIREDRRVWSHCCLLISHVVYLLVKNIFLLKFALGTIFYCLCSKENRILNGNYFFRVTKRENAMWNVCRLVQNLCIWNVISRIVFI